MISSPPFVPLGIALAIGVLSGAILWDVVSASILFVLSLIVYSVLGEIKRTEERHANTAKKHERDAFISHNAEKIERLSNDMESLKNLLSKNESLRKSFDTIVQKQKQVYQDVTETFQHNLQVLEETHKENLQNIISTVSSLEDELNYYKSKLRNLEEMIIETKRNAERSNSQIQQVYNLSQRALAINLKNSDTINNHTDADPTSLTSENNQRPDVQINSIEEKKDIDSTGRHNNIVIEQEDTTSVHREKSVRNILKLADESISSAENLVSSAMNKRTEYENELKMNNQHSPKTHSNNETNTFVSSNKNDNIEKSDDSVNNNNNDNFERTKNLSNSRHSNLVKNEGGIVVTTKDDNVIELRNSNKLQLQQTISSPSATIKSHLSHSDQSRQSDMQHAINELKRSAPNKLRNCRIEIGNYQKKAETSPPKTIPQKIDNTKNIEDGDDVDEEFKTLKIRDNQLNVDEKRDSSNKSPTSPRVLSTLVHSSPSVLVKETIQDLREMENNQNNTNINGRNNNNNNNNNNDNDSDNITIAVDKTYSVDINNEYDLDNEDKTTHRRSKDDSKLVRSTTGYLKPQVDKKLLLYMNPLVELSSSLIKRNTGSSHLLQAAHRSARTTSEEIKLDFETLDKISDDQPNDTNSNYERNVYNDIIVNPKRNSYAVSEVNIILPYGAKIEIECFHDASYEEVIDTIWDKLKPFTKNRKFNLTAKQSLTLTNILLRKDFVLVDNIFHTIDANEKELVMNLFSEMVQNNILEYAISAIRYEIKYFHESINSLFRSNAFSTIFITCAIRSIGHKYVMDIINPVIQVFISENRMDGDTGNNSHRIIYDAAVKTSLEFLEAINNSMKSCPVLIKQICREAYLSTAKAFPGHELKAISALIFLRFMCPAILSSPVLEGNIEGRRRIIKVTKVLQLLANQVQNSSEAWIANNNFAEVVIKHKEYIDNILLAFTLFDPDECKLMSKDISPISTRSQRDILMDFHLICCRTLQPILIYFQEVTKFDAHHDVREIDEIIEKLTEIYGYPLDDRKDYFLKLFESDYYFPTRCNPLEELSKLNITTSSIPTLVLIDKTQSRREKLNISQIAYLINSQKLPSWNFTKSEADYFRKFFLQNLTDYGALPSHITKRCNLEYPKVNRSFVLQVHLPGEKFSKSLFTSPTEYTADIMVQIVRKSKHLDFDPSEYIFKIGGYDQYVEIENLRLGDIKYIQQALLLKHRIHFSMVKKPSVISSNNEERRKSPFDVKSNISANFSDLLTLRQLYYSEMSENPVNISTYFKADDHFVVSINQILQLESSNFRNKLESYGTYLFAQVGLYYNAVAISPLLRTNPTSFMHPIWNEKLSPQLPYYQLPRECRLCVSIYAVNKKNAWKAPVGWASLRIFNEEGELIQGKHTLRLWPNAKASNTGPCSLNPSSKDFNVQVVLEFPTFNNTLIFGDESYTPYFTSVDTISASSESSSSGNEVGRPRRNTSGWVNNYSANNFGTVTPDHDHKVRRLSNIMSVRASITFANIPDDSSSSISFPNDGDMAAIKKILNTPHNYILLKEEKALLWRYRKFCSCYLSLLPKLLTSIVWSNKDEVKEVYKMLAYWNQNIRTSSSTSSSSPRSSTISYDPFSSSEEKYHNHPAIYLQLLSPNFEDQIVRSFAVQQLQKLTEDELQSLLISLVDCLAFEPYFVSPLSIFLLETSLRKRKLIGYQFFWLLFSRTSLGVYSERYSLLLEAYLRGAGYQREVFTHQVEFYLKLDAILNCIRDIEHSNGNRQQSEYLVSELKRLKLPPNFNAPFDPTLIVDQLVLDQSLIIEENNKSLLMSFSNKDYFITQPVNFIFQTSYDLKFSLIVSQIIQFINHELLLRDLNLYLYQFKCVPTAPNKGYYEVVDGYITFSNLKNKIDAFAGEILRTYFYQHNTSEQDLKSAKENFIYSCSGFCLMSYLLGENNPDHIFVSPTGFISQLFLPVETKKRHKTALNLLPDFINFLGPEFERFVQISCKSFIIIREIFYPLSILYFQMVKNGYRKEEDLLTLREQLFLHLNNEEASIKFRDIILKSLTSTSFSRFFN